MQEVRDSGNSDRMEELAEAENAHAVVASDGFVQLLRRHHPEHDVPGIDDVEQPARKKRVWPKELR